MKVISTLQRSTQLSFRELQEFLSELSQKQREQGRSDYTVKKTYDALRTFFSFLHRENVVYVNPMANIPSPRTSRRLLHPLTQDEVTALLSVLNFILQGGNPFVLQEILGHATLDMTRRYVSLANQSFTGQRVSFMDKLAEQGQASLPKRKLF